MAHHLGDVEYLFGDLGHQDVLVVVAGHRQKDVGMIDAALLQIVLHHGFGSEDHSDPWVGGHAFQTVPLATQHGDVRALPGQVGH